MKTIFFLLHSGIVVRNFLFTGILDKLLEKDDVRVVIFSRLTDVFEKKLTTSERLIIERFPDRNEYSMSRLFHSILRRRYYKLNPTHSLKILSKGPMSPRRGQRLIDFCLSQPFPKSRTIYRWLEALVRRVRNFSDEVPALFKQYQPSLVVSTNPTSMCDYDFLKYAKQKNVTTVGIIKSWDVLTLRGYIPVHTDSYLAWHRIMKEQLVTIHNIDEKKINIIGVPQFDIYSDLTGISSREEFLSKLNLDYRKKTILFATSPAWINPDDPEILKKLISNLAESNMDSVQIIVRLHQQDSPERYREIVHPHVSYQVFDTHLKHNKELEFFDPSLLVGLRDTLAHSDVVINTTSTISLDAVAMDRPVVNIAFDLKPKKYYKSCRRYCDFDHYRPVVQSEATSITRNISEFMSAIHSYLKNPEYKSVEREQLRETMCYKVDGKSAYRVVKHIHAIIDQNLKGEVVA